MYLTDTILVIMNRKRLILTIILAVSAIVLTTSILYLPSPKEIDYSGFSAKRASSDIKAISQEPHSIYHPEERAKVRDYLAARLKESGVDTQIFSYDSIKDRSGYYYTVSNIYGVIDPVGVKPDSYILLLAHYDSCPEREVKGEKVLSFGAADDGYGIAVIIELLSNMLQIRDQWIQGVKILFTDSEEYGLYGISNAIKRDRHIFENVGLVINLEARGVKGPAILFETSPGNSSLIELYSKASKPYAYSFTSAVYNQLPNYTDFTLLKDTLPGINFSVIDNLKYYHTDKDNYSNISLRSVQHYGEQLMPMLTEYLTDIKYSDSEYFRSPTNSVYFTVPFLGLFAISAKGYLIIMIITSVVFLILLLAYMKQSRISVRSIATVMLINLLIISVASASAYIVAYGAAYLNGVKFRIINLAHIEYEYIITVIFLTLFTVLYTLIYIRIIRKRRISSLNFIASGNIIMLILSFLLFYKIGDSVIFFIPSFISVALFLLNILNYMKYLNIIGIVLLLMFISPIIYALSVALTIGSLFAVTAIWGLSLWLLLPLTDRFVRRFV